MKTSPIFWGLILFCGLTGTANADIYSWVDADGVRHFSNHVPPTKGVAVEISIETLHVPPSAEEQLEVQQAEILAEAQQKIAEMEAESIERLRAAERKIEAARQEATQAREEAQDLLKAAEEKSRNVNKTVVYYGYFPYRPHEPFHKKMPVQLPSRVGKDLQHMPYETLKSNPGPKTHELSKAGYQNRTRLNSVHRPGGFTVKGPPEFFLRVR